jgi:hypothetical protein
MITLNGTVKFRSRRLPIFWTGEFAQHLSERNNELPSTHPYLHVEAQQYYSNVLNLKKEVKALLALLKKTSRKLI